MTRTRNNMTTTMQHIHGDARLQDHAAQAFQHDFVQALLSGSMPCEDSDGTAYTVTTQPAFAVYRNTVLRGCVDALQANFPCVARLVGEDWFRAAAAHHAFQTPPHDGRLLYYGTTFAHFLGGLPSTSELPYLQGVALLDDAYRHALGAADAAVLDPALLAHHSAESLAAMVLRPHPAARWHHFATAPVFAIWQRERVQVEGLAGDAPAQDIAWEPDGALITRPHATVVWRALDAAGCAFMDACAAGQPLQAAADHALAAGPATDLASLLRDLLCAGAFQGATR
jgi:hypothetical protein